MKTAMKKETENDSEMNCGCVKGVCFHPKRDWILAGLQTGMIEVWDYTRRYRIDAFEGHDGAVRGMDFHRSESRFVSGGGDDCKIKVWNFDTRHCFFTLLGHKGSVNTVEFHKNCPWILSASSDKTIRIWNHMEGTCLSTLPAQAGCITSASFHPSEDLVLSSSTDTVVRIWDLPSFGVKHELHGHHRPVHWACFHPSENLIVSADSTKLNLWDMDVVDAEENSELYESYELDGFRNSPTETEGSVVATMEKHQANITCVVFLSEQIVSASEDKTILIWGLKQREVLKTIVREQDRFWVMAKHPETNQLAAGHDSGVVVFKAVRDRPAFVVRGDTLFYVKDQLVIKYDFTTQNKEVIFQVNGQPKTISAMTCSSGEEIFFLSFVISAEHNVSKLWRKCGNGLNEIGEFAVGIDDTNFIVLRDRMEKEIEIFKIQNGHHVPGNRVAIPAANPDALLFAGDGNLLFSSKGRIYLIHAEPSFIIADLETPPVKQAIWSKDRTQVALLSKRAITLASKALVHTCTIKERVSVKSGAWDDDVGVFVYTTLGQIKYCLPNGESGIIKTLDCPLYILKVSKNTIFCLNREAEIKTVLYDAADYRIKISLLNQASENAVKIASNSHLCGLALSSYVQNKGFPELAMHLLKDEKLLFKLALESGNIDSAVALAESINEIDCWNDLGVQAVRFGKVGIAKKAYQRAENFQKLSFLYLATGNFDKLTRMTETGEGLDDVFQNALYACDIPKRVSILEKNNCLPLAYMTASVHGLHATAKRIADELGVNAPTLPQGKVASLLMPPAPVMRGTDWPLQETVQGLFDDDALNV